MNDIDGNQRSMIVKSNPIKSAVGRGELQIGTWLNMLRNPESLTMFKQAGLDYVRKDM